MVLTKIIKKIKGFTLVEILVVLTVLIALFIVSSLTVPKLLMRARDAIRKGHLNSYSKAVDTYYQDLGCYPQTVPTCKNPLVLGDLVLKDSLPCDPQTNFSYTYITDSSECPNWFQIYTNLEVVEDRVIAKLGCERGCGPACQFNYGVSSSNQKLDPFCAVGDPPLVVEQYVCGTNKTCEVYADPVMSGCPNIYPNDPTCQNACSNPQNRCHDARGKTN